MAARDRTLGRTTETPAGKVIADQSVSLDGFSAGPNVGPGNPLGDRGDRLHEWTNQEGGAKIPEELFQASGAVVMGRRMLDVGVEPWGRNPPFDSPVFVITHRVRDPLVREGGTTYHFVTHGIEGALAQARAAARGKDVAVLGGANVIREFIEAGLLDELRLHLAHVLLGEGTRFFDRLGPEQLALKRTSVIDSPGAIHITFRVVGGRF